MFQQLFSDAPMANHAIGPQKPGPATGLLPKQRYELMEVTAQREDLLNEAQKLRIELALVGLTPARWFESLDSDWDTYDVRLYIAMQELCARQEGKPLSPEFMYTAQFYLP